MYSTNNNKNNFKKIPQDLKKSSNRPISNILGERKKITNKENSSTTVKLKIK
jgi:hypothetical protein